MNDGDELSMEISPKGSIDEETTVKNELEPSNIDIKDEVDKEKEEEERNPIYSRK